MGFPIVLNPEIIEKAQKLKIFAEDIAEEFVRGSGAGGQKINKTSSCVWLKHLPTGIEVKCQMHRERAKNRASAYKLLILKIEERVLGKKSAEAVKDFKLRKQKKRRSRRAKEKMMHDKAVRGQIKELRRVVL